MKILVVEDDPAGREIVVRRLVRKGYSVEAVEDGETALAQAATGAFDLLVLDIGLPGIDGFEVARRLRADPKTAGLLILGLSAHAMRGDREQALAAGLNDYDTKPVDFARLVERIEALRGRP